MFSLYIRTAYAYHNYVVYEAFEDKICVLLRSRVNNTSCCNVIFDLFGCICDSKASYTLATVIEKNKHCS